MDYFSELLNSYNLLKKRKLKLVEEKTKEEEKGISVSNLPAQEAGKQAKKAPAKPKTPKATKATEKKPSKELSPKLPVPGEKVKKEKDLKDLEGAEEPTGVEGIPVAKELEAPIVYPPELMELGFNLTKSFTMDQMDPESDGSKVLGLIKSQYDPEDYAEPFDIRIPKDRERPKDAQGNPVPEWASTRLGYLSPKQNGQSYQSVLRNMFMPGNAQPGTIHKAVQTAQGLTSLGDSGEFFDLKPIETEISKDPQFKLKIESSVLKNFSRLTDLLAGFTKQRRLSIEDAQWMTNTFKFYTVDDKFMGIIVETDQGITLRFTDGQKFMTSMLKSAEKVLVESEITSLDFPQDEIKDMYKGLGRIDEKYMASKAMEYKQSRIGTIIEEATPLLKSLIRPTATTDKEEIARSLLLIMKKNIDQMKNFMHQFEQAEINEDALDADVLPAVQFIKEFIARDENGDFEIAKIISRLMMNIKKDRFYKTGQVTLPLGKDVGLGKRADHGHVFNNKEELFAELGPNALQDNEVFIGTFEELTKLGYGKSVDGDSIPGQIDPATGQKTIIVAMNGLKTPKYGTKSTTALGSGSMEQVRRVMGNDPEAGNPEEVTAWGQQITRYSGVTPERYLELDDFYRDGTRTKLDYLTRRPRATITRSGQTPIQDKPIAEDTLGLVKSWLEKELTFQQRHDPKSYASATYKRLGTLYKDLSKRKGFELDTFITENKTVLDGVVKGISFSVMTRNLRRDLQDRSNPNYERAISYMAANIFSFGGLAQDKMNTHINPTHEDASYEVRQNQILKDAFDGLKGDTPTWEAEVTESGTWILRNIRNKNQTITCTVEKTFSQGKKDNYNNWIVEISGDIVKAYNKRHLQPTIQTEQTEISSMIEEFLQNQRKILEALTHKVGIR